LENQDRPGFSSPTTAIGSQRKIRCHLFACIVAMIYLKILELKLEENSCYRTASDIMAGVDF
jgi:hypothetical protein